MFTLLSIYLLSLLKENRVFNRKEREMGILYEDAVLIKEAEGENEHTVITVNCPDKTGLGCDLCRIILLFGLSIARGGMMCNLYCSLFCFSCFFFFFAY